MDHVEQMAALALLGEQKRLIRMLDGEGSAKEEMCKAIDDLIEDGWMRGKVEGKAEGKAESILALLEELGSIPEGLSAKIKEQSDAKILTKWLKLAARAKDLEQFGQEMWECRG